MASEISFDAFGPTWRVMAANGLRRAGLSVRCFLEILEWSSWGVFLFSTVFLSGPSERVWQPNRDAWDVVMLVDTFKDGNSMIIMILRFICVSNMEALLQNL